MATKPEGITIGDGTQGSPYEVHNYDEIKWCCEDAEAIPPGQTATSDCVYLKLVDNIDCQEYDVDFLWSITCTHWVDFNLNNRTIKTFYIANGSSMFVHATFTFRIHDGKILNVYGHWELGSNGIIEGAGAFMSAINISFSADGSKLHSLFYNSAGSTTTKIVKNCSIWMQGVKPTGGNGDDPITRAAVAFTCCDFMLYMNADTYFTNGRYLIATTSLFTNCRFRGTVNWNIESTNMSLVSLATLRNCVWAVNLKIIASTNPNCWVIRNGSTSTYGIYNVDLLDIPSVLTNFHFDYSNHYIECHNTDMDMRYNPNADARLVELGFDVIKG